MGIGTSRGRQRGRYIERERERERGRGREVTRVFLELLAKWWLWVIC